ncbi:RNA polymerase sigma factor [Streptomyces sp. NPDC021093]|uniref:RNA polymerase sigma factor n=1 Tax=Streptomyces sp. NPDC021093 TaxID=3365112 RepID=UPI00379F4C3E
MAQQDGKPAKTPGLLKYFRPELFTPRRGVLNAIGGTGEEGMLPRAVRQWHYALDASGPGYYALKQRLTKEHAEDIWQTVLLGVWRHLLSHGPVESIGGFVATSVRNETVRYIGKMRANTQTLVGQVPEFEATDDSHVPDNLADLHHRALELAKDLDGLVPPEQAEALILTDAYRLDSKLVAEMTNTSHTVVRNRASRARKELRKPLVEKQLHTRLGMTD